MAKPFNIQVHAVNLPGFQQELLNIAKQIRLTLAATMRLSGREIERDIKDQLLSGRPGVRVASGALRASLHHLVTGPDIAPNLNVFFTGRVPYTNTQIYGATIFPRNARFLAIPLPIGTPGSLSSSPGQVGGKLTYGRLSGIHAGRGGILSGGGRSWLLARSVHVPGRVTPEKILRIATKNIHERLVARLKIMFDQVAAGGRPLLRDINTAGSYKW